MLLSYSGDPEEEETAAAAAEDGGGDELQLGTVPSLKPIQTAPTTAISLLFVRRRRSLFSYNLWSKRKRKIPPSSSSSSPSPVSRSTARAAR